MVEQFLLPVVLKNNGYCERAVDLPLLQNYQTVSLLDFGSFKYCSEKFPTSSYESY
jgi:hypothetical protein